LQCWLKSLGKTSLKIDLLDWMEKKGVNYYSHVRL
jgi:hypothetical protein